MVNVGTQLSSSMLSINLFQHAIRISISAVMVGTQNFTSQNVGTQILSPPIKP